MTYCEMQFTTPPIAVQLVNTGAGWYGRYPALKPATMAACDCVHSRPSLGPQHPDKAKAAMQAIRKLVMVVAPLIVSATLLAGGRDRQGLVA